MHAILILHGPNLNLLGMREPEIYGSQTLDEINTLLGDLAEELGVSVHPRQSNSEGQLIELMHEARGWAAGIVFNAAGYTHTSVALRDAITSVNLPTVEVHLSNIYKREDFRQHSLIAPVCIGTISGFGAQSYLLGLRALVAFLDQSQNKKPRTNENR